MRECDYILQKEWEMNGNKLKAERSRQESNK